MNTLQLLLEKYPDKPWNWYRVSSNPNITMEIIETYPDKPWNWYGVSYNPNLTMEMIEKYPDKPWDWYGVSKNPNITMEIIEKYPDKPWDWQRVSRNPNITMEFIEKNINKIEFRYLSSNHFTFQNKVIKHKADKMNLRMWMDNANNANSIPRIGTHAQAVVTSYLLKPGTQKKYGSYL